MKTSRIWLSVSVALGSSVALATNWPTSLSAPTQLEAAHEDYLSGNFANAAAKIKDILAGQNKSSSVVGNAISLADAIQQRMKCEPYPAGWELPEKVVDLRINQVRREQEGRVSYYVTVNGVSEESDTVTQLQLRDASGNVILDRKDQRGEWTIEPEEGNFKFTLEQSRVPQPLNAGLYFIVVETKDQKRVEGYVILSNHVASKSPNVTTPLPNQTISTGNPTIAWDDFHSPESGSCDRRSTYVHVRFRSSSESAWARNFFEYPLPTSAVVGPEGEPGIAQLSAGSYAVSVRANENIKFGPMRIRRVAVTTVPFRVE